MCFPHDLFEVGFAEGCAEGGIAGGGMATSAGNTSVELAGPQLVSASGRPQLWSGVWLMALLGPPSECGCRFCTRCSPILDEI